MLCHLVAAASSEARKETKIRLGAGRNGSLIRHASPCRTYRPPRVRPRSATPLRHS